MNLYLQNYQLRVWPDQLLGDPRLGHRGPVHHVRWAGGPRVQAGWPQPRSPRQPRGPRDLPLQADLAAGRQSDRPGEAGQPQPPHTSGPGVWPQSRDRGRRSERPPPSDQAGPLLLRPLEDSREGAVRSQEPHLSQRLSQQHQGCQGHWSVPWRGGLQVSDSTSKSLIIVLWLIWSLTNLSDFGCCSILFQIKLCCIKLSNLTSISVRILMKQLICSGSPPWEASTCPTMSWSPSPPRHSSPRPASRFSSSATTRSPRSTTERCPASRSSGPWTSPVIRDSISLELNNAQY